MGDDEEQLELFYQRSYGRLVAAVALVAGTRGEAEELVQEAFVRLVPRWRTVGRYENPEAWVRLVAVRLAVKRERRRRLLARLVPLSADADPAHGACAPQASVAARVDVRAALQRLPVDQRVVVVLHYYADEPVDAIARQLGVPAGTVKSRLSRARGTLRNLLEEPLEQPLRRPEGAAP